MSPTGYGSSSGGGMCGSFSRQNASACSGVGVEQSGALADRLGGGVGHERQLTAGTAIGQDVAAVDIAAELASCAWSVMPSGSQVFRPVGALRRQGARHRPYGARSMVRLNAWPTCGQRGRLARHDASRERSVYIVIWVEGKSAKPVSSVTIVSAPAEMAAAA